LVGRVGLGVEIGDRVLDSRGINGLFVPSQYRKLLLGPRPMEPQISFYDANSLVLLGTAGVLEYLLPFELSYLVHGGMSDVAGVQVIEQLLLHVSQSGALGLKSETTVIVESPVGGRRDFSVETARHKGMDGVRGISDLPVSGVRRDIFHYYLGLHCQQLR
jgi:hypothetical protein